MGVADSRVRPGCVRQGQVRPVEEVPGRLEGFRSVVGQDGHVLEVLVQALRPPRKLSASDAPRERAHIDLVGEDVDVAVELAPEGLVRQPRSQARLVRRNLGGIGGGRHPDVEDDPARLRHARGAVVEASHELEHLGPRAWGARENLGRELVERPGFALLDVEAALRHSLPGENSRLVEGRPRRADDLRRPRHRRPSTSTST